MGREIRELENCVIIRRNARSGDGASTLQVSTLFWFAPETPRMARIELDEAHAAMLRPGLPAEVALEVADAGGARWQAIPVSGGSASRRAVQASRPPAEAPIPTTCKACKPVAHRSCGAGRAPRGSQPTRLRRNRVTVRHDEIPKQSVSLCGRSGVSRQWCYARKNRTIDDGPVFANAASSNVRSSTVPGLSDYHPGHDRRYPS